MFTPPLSSDYVSQGDFLRLLSYGVLLVGVWRAIRAAEFGRAVAEERARVAREIHDGLAQYLFAISTQTSMLAGGADLDKALPRLQEAAAAAQQEARFAVLALSSAGGTAPFDSALNRYVEFLTADGALDVDLEIERGVELGPDEQIEIFRIVQEGLANVRRHASARRATVLIGLRDGQRVVRIVDDGDGFDDEAREPRAGPPQHARPRGGDRRGLPPGQRGRRWHVARDRAREPSRRSARVRLAEQPGGAELAGTLVEAAGSSRASRRRGRSVSTRRSSSAMSEAGSRDRRSAPGAAALPRGSGRAGLAPGPPSRPSTRAGPPRWCPRW